MENTKAVFHLFIAQKTPLLHFIMCKMVFIKKALYTLSALLAPFLAAKWKNKRFEKKIRYM